MAGVPSSVVSNFAILWTVACQALFFMKFPKQKCWSELPCNPLGKSPRDLPDLGIEPMFSFALVLQADSLQLSHQERLKWDQRGTNIIVH